jgi:hypothetical protein
MSKKQWLLAFVLCDFSLLNAYAVYQYGAGGILELLTANAVTVAALVDLTIALTLVLVWMRNDARSRGIAFLPYLALTLLFGSVGPLLYLLRTAGQSEATPAPTRLAANSAALR